MKPSLARCLLLLALAATLPAAGRLRAAEDSPTAYTALRLVGRELGADSLGRIVAVGGREGVPQPFVWRITLGAKPGGTGENAGARELEVAGGRIVANRPARRTPAGAVTIDLKNLNLDSSGAFTTTDAESRRLHLPFSALNYELRADPTAGNRPVWTVQLLDGDHRPLGSLLLAATDGTQIRATGQLAEGGRANPAGGAPVIASTSTDRPPAAEARVASAAPSTRRSTVTTTTSSSTSRPVAPGPVEDEPVREGGFLERAGRTLDRTPGRIERGVRRTGANVGESIQRFFDPDARRD